MTKPSNQIIKTILLAVGVVVTATAVFRSEFLVGGTAIRQAEKRRQDIISKHTLNGDADDHPHSAHTMVWRAPDNSQQPVRGSANPVHILLEHTDNADEAAGPAHQYLLQVGISWSAHNGDSGCRIFNSRKTGCD